MLGFLICSCPTRHYHHRCWCRQSDSPACQRRLVWSSLPHTSGVPDIHQAGVSSGRGSWKRTPRPWRLGPGGMIMMRMGHGACPRSFSLAITTQGRNRAYWPRIGIRNPALTNPCQSPHPPISSWAVMPAEVNSQRRVGECLSGAFRRLESKINNRNTIMMGPMTHLVHGQGPSGAPWRCLGRGLCAAPKGPSPARPAAGLYQHGWTYQTSA